jgi:hypothetical protein
MIEKIGNQDIFVRNYTSNIDVKQFIQDVLIPKAFPDIPVNKLNLGLTGIASEMISQAIEDSYGTASLMMNESFITRAVIPSSIYSEASLFNLGYTFATPSQCNFAVQLWLEDIIKHATRVSNTLTMRYKLDKNTKVILGENIYKLEYDIIIDYQYIDGKIVFNVYYDIDEKNSISTINSQYIKHQVTSIGWLVLFLPLQEFDRKVDENAITDNLVTVNSDIFLKWTRQIAGLDLVYITPRGERIPMKLKNQYTNPEQDPFAWYSFYNDNTIRLSFSNNKGFFQPEFNSRVESTIYTCRGKVANFGSYDRKTAVPIQKTGDRFEYNANTRIVALCYSGSTNGLDKGDLETLRQDVILAYNSVNVLTTDYDLQLWYTNFAKRNGIRAEFFKRRDDPSGRLFSQFISISDDTYVYPTNTLTIDVEQTQFDFINNDDLGINKEFIIKPGHLWEYADYDEYQVDSYGNPVLDNDGNKIYTGKKIQVRDRVRMVKGTEGMALITDDAIPQINTDRPFMFVNPFYIKINRQPSISANYNCLINHTSWPEDIPINSEIFYKFQLATFSIERDLSKKYNNKYKIQVICVPVVSSDKSMKYVEDIGEEFLTKNNNLRLILITRTKADGETGYIEMKPVELRNGDAILFESTISVYDNLRSDMNLEIDINKTPEIKSLITSGVNQGKVFLDSSETSFHFAVMMKDFTNVSTSNLFDSEDFKGYIMANRFGNDYRNLTLYKPMAMMRSVITFAGQNNDYKVRSSLVPFLKYDIPLDSDKMSYFIRAFAGQYEAMEPVVKRLDGNSNIDFKLFNTYGRSNNYYIGPENDSDILWNSNILLDNVYVKSKWRLSVFDRSIYSQTADSVMNEIKTCFESLDSGQVRDVHISSIIHAIKENHPNVNYIRFLGFNDYDANKQSIFTKYDSLSELRGDQLQVHVPEMIRVDSSSIDIKEEV